MNSLKEHVEHSLLADVSGRRQLWGHTLGRVVRGRIDQDLEKLQPGATLVVQLKGIEVMDFSFASEVFGKVIGAMGRHHPGCAILLANPHEYVKTNLDAALQSLGLIALTAHGARRWDLIGKIAETDRDTVGRLAIRKQATAPELAEDLGIQLTTCNQRLRKLIDYGVIIRVRTRHGVTGEQYEYRWPI